MHMLLVLLLHRDIYADVKYIVVYDGTNGIRFVSASFIDDVTCAGKVKGATKNKS